MLLLLHHSKVCLSLTTWHTQNEWTHMVVPIVITYNLFHFLYSDFKMAFELQILMYKSLC
jgi:hypothetical protein